jgi:hypothetical protein
LQDGINFAHKNLSHNIPIWPRSQLGAARRWSVAEVVWPVDRGLRATATSGWGRDCGPGLRFVTSPPDLATLHGILSQFEGWFSPDGFWWLYGGPFTRAPSGRWALFHGGCALFLPFSLMACGVWKPGRRPWLVGVLLVAGRARGSGAGRCPWSRGRRDTGELHGVAAVCLLFQRRSVPCVAGWEHMPRGNPCPPGPRRRRPWTSSPS